MGIFGEGICRYQDNSGSWILISQSIDGTPARGFQIRETYYLEGTLWVSATTPEGGSLLEFDQFSKNSNSLNWKRKDPFEIIDPLQPDSPIFAAQTEDRIAVLNDTTFGAYQEPEGWTVFSHNLPTHNYTIKDFFGLNGNYLVYMENQNNQYFLYFSNDGQSFVPATGLSDYPMEFPPFYFDGYYYLGGFQFCARSADGTHWEYITAELNQRGIGNFQFTGTIPAGDSLFAYGRGVLALISEEEGWTSAFPNFLNGNLLSIHRTEDFVLLEREYPFGVSHLFTSQDGIRWEVSNLPREKLIYNKINEIASNDQAVLFRSFSRLFLTTNGEDWFQSPIFAAEDLTTGSDGRFYIAARLTMQNWQQLFPDTEPNFNLLLLASPDGIRWSYVGELLETGGYTEELFHDNTGKFLKVTNRNDFIFSLDSGARWNILPENPLTKALEKYGVENALILPGHEEWVAAFSLPFSPYETQVLRSSDLENWIDISPSSDVEIQDGYFQEGTFVLGGSYFPNGEKGYDQIPYILRITEGGGSVSTTPHGQNRGSIDHFVRHEKESLALSVVERFPESPKILHLGDKWAPAKDGNIVFNDGVYFKDRWILIQEQPGAIISGSNDPNVKWFPGASGQNFGWNRSTLGSYLTDYLPWLVHREHGIWYCPDFTSSNQWIYDYELGWLYISLENYPYLYQYSTREYIYFHQGSRFPRYFYRFSGESPGWRPVDQSSPQEK